MGGLFVKAITVKQPGGAEQLQMTEQPIPEPNNDEVLIKVKTAAVNRTDIVQRKSHLGYMKNSILGVEVAGTVEKVGGNSHIKVGTHVMGLVNGGGYAEYVCMPADRAMVIPDNLSFTEAAAIPEVFLTAYQTLFWIGQLSKDEHVLIHAGGSGVGTAAIQLAKKIGQARVIATAGSEEKLHFCQSLGADVGINYKKKDFAEEVLKYTNQEGVELILDFIGSSYFEKNLSSIKIDGRWVLIGVLGGATVKNVNLFDIMSKRIQLTGTLLTPRSDAYKAALTSEFSKKALPLFKNNMLRPIVDSVFSLDDIQQAHEHMESNKNIGKIIIQIR